MTCLSADMWLPGAYVEVMATQDDFTYGSLGAARSRDLGASFIDLVLSIDCQKL